MKYCVAAPERAVDPSCSVVVVDHYASDSKQLSESGWTLGFKAAIDPSCTLDLVEAGLCSACPAAAVLSGKCPPGTHTLVTNIVAPSGLVSNTSLAVTMYIGSSILSAEVIARFEVVSNTQDMDRPSHASARLRQMLVSTQVLSNESTLLLLLCWNLRCCPAQDAESIAIRKNYHAFLRDCSVRERFKPFYEQILSVSATCCRIQ